MAGALTQWIATSFWYRVAGLLCRKELAIDIIRGEIGPSRSCSRPSRLTHASADVERAAKTPRDLAERIIRPKP